MTHAEDPAPTRCLAQPLINPTPLPQPAHAQLKEGLPVIITTLDGAVRDLAFELAGEAAWVLEMLSASRRLCNHIG